MENERKITKSSQCCGAEWSKMANIIWMGIQRLGEI